MFYHVKELQYQAKVSRPDPKFARLLLEQFGGPNGELKAAMQYFIQAFPCRKAFPDKYDMLMDIATEEFSHLEIVGATIQMLLTGVSGDLKDAADQSEIMQTMDKSSKENYIHESMMNPQFFVLSGGGPTLTDSNGNPWTAAYVTANGDLSVDLRSNMAAESRAKIVYEYLMKFTDDPFVKDSLRFLMTREIAHFQMFEAALDTIQPNFPPAVLQGDPRFSNKYFNLSNGEEYKGPWNEGMSSQLGEEWQYVEDPKTYCKKTHGLVDEKIVGTDRTEEEVQEINAALSKERSEEILAANPTENIVWDNYPDKPTSRSKSK